MNALWFGRNCRRLNPQVSDIEGMDQLPPQALQMIQELKEQGVRIDENNPEQVLQLLSYVARMSKTVQMLPEADCLKGSQAPNPELPSPSVTHFTKNTPLYGPFGGKQVISFGMGCFWCSEDVFLREPEVYSTQVGYLGGATINPTYQQVCSGRTNHNEVVRIVYEDPSVLPKLLKIFWELHNPTTLNQQGNDKGTQYRSGIYWSTEEQKEVAERSKDLYQQAIDEKFGSDVKTISTEILESPEFWMAEDYHQQVE